MRITIINQFYAPDISPTAHLAASLAEHRAALGDEVTVVASRGGYVEESRDGRAARDENPRVHRVWTPKLGKKTTIRRCIDYGVFYALAFLRLLTLKRQDVIVALTTPPFIGLTGVAHKLLHPRCKLILWCMDCYPEAAERSDMLKETGLPSRFMRFLNRFLFRRLDHLVCLDTAMVELLMSQYAPKKRPPHALPVTVIPNWEPLAFFPADARPAPWPKAAELIPTGNLVVLYLGNMGVGHDFETVLDAAGELHADPVSFLFIGGGAKKEPVANEASQRGLSNIIVHGYVPKEETPSVMATAHAALITLRDRVLGVMSPSKLHANLAASLPVVYVGPEKSNVDDAVTGYGCGISIRHGDTAALVAFVRSLIADRARLDALRAKARRAFEEAYNDTRTLPKFDQIIDALAPGARRSSAAAPAAETRA